ncbi:hypothetical protein J2W40_001603 [Sphingobium xenophagum]|uniref:Iron uptake protein n=2 Tax=Sphingobium xenophagum TaxID=121428 RepID=A0ABU1WZP8_SPHXE|nr:hypothetical protein [Sphingobium xenophagum]
MTSAIAMSKQARHRWSVAARSLAGTLGAYGVTALFTAALSLLLARIGMDRVEAVTAATLLSFAVFALIAMAVFHARSAVRAWIWLIGASIPVGAALLALLPGVRG